MSATYRNHHFTTIARMELNHFWFRSRSRMLRRLIEHFVPESQGVTFLEMGCGTGIVLRLLERMSFSATGLDVNHRAIELSRRGTKAQLIRSSLHSFQTNERYACIGAFDVLEHQTDDLGFLRKCYQLLQPGGYLFLTVPAGVWLWSRIDEQEGHKRRYDPAQLLHRLEKAGFRVRYWNFWQVVTLPVYWLWRAWIDRGKHSSVGHYLKELPWYTNELLFRLLTLEELWFWRLRYPAGATLAVVAQRPQLGGRSKSALQ